MKPSKFQKAYDGAFVIPDCALPDVRESFKYFCTPKDFEPYAQEIFTLLQEVDKLRGLCEMINTIEDLMTLPNFWKLHVRENKVSAFMLYELKGEFTKVIAGGSDGTIQGEEDLKDLAGFDYNALV